MVPLCVLYINWKRVQWTFHRCLTQHNRFMKTLDVVYSNFVFVLAAFRRQPAIVTCTARRQMSTLGAIGLMPCIETLQAYWQKKGDFSLMSKIVWFHCKFGEYAQWIATKNVRKKNLHALHFKWTMLSKYHKTSSRGAYGHDPVWSVFEEYPLDSTRSDSAMTLAMI